MRGFIAVDSPKGEDTCPGFLGGDAVAAPVDTAGLSNLPPAVSPVLDKLLFFPDSSVQLRQRCSGGVRHAIMGL
jgi:hypothetical protein